MRIRSTDSIFTLKFEDDSEESPVKLPPGHLMDAEEVKRYEEVGGFQIYCFFFVSKMVDQTFCCS